MRCIALIGLFISLVLGCEKASEPKSEGFTKAEYYLHVEEVVPAVSRYVDKPLRINGRVEAGSVMARGDEKRFVLARKGQRLTVHYRGVLPESFRDEAEAVVAGRLVKRDGETHFNATEVLTKCPEKYDSAPGAPGR